MALKGTLKDFGIADILQLIGQQQKTGVLYLKGKNEEVEVSFVDGNVVRAQSQTRKNRELLGAMLVSSGLLTQDELEEALETQKRTLKRLGDILLNEGRVSGEELREMTQLQTTETVYRLFTWKAGTYEFIQQDVEHDPVQGASLRPESVLMEGFRRIDEWPMVRRRLPSLTHTFVRLKPLAPLPLGAGSSGEDVDAALDAALSDSAVSAPTPKSIGRSERAVYRLAEPELSAQRLSELSRLGEFETCKALYNLIEAGYLEAVPARKKTPSPGTAPLARPRFELSRRLGQSAVQLVIGLCLVGLFALAAGLLSAAPTASTSGAVTLTVSSDLSERVVAGRQMARIRDGLEQYRLSRGAYPERLGELVERGLVESSELERPYTKPYHYRLEPGGSYVLLPPLR